ncbi:MAG: acyl-CoA dehydrogenase family protein [Nannocystaceae bacterium]|nr:acyl-CoA dehydrogenase family protein [Nannocystaceae bacterium]
MVDKSSSFMRSLCMGRIEEDIVFPFPAMDPDEREMLTSVIDSVDSLLGPLEDDFRKWDQAGEMPDEFLQKLKDFGLFGLCIPEEFGGMGMGSAAYSRTLQQVATHDASVAVTIGAHSSIGMRGLLLFGTDEQKQRFLPKLATGEMLAAFCLTEAGAGSDAASVATTAIRDGDDWVLNGTKIWITNGGIADFFTVFAKIEQDGDRARLCAFIVTRDMDGVTTGPHEDKMGLRASSTTSVYLDNVRVPSTNILGPDNAGFKVAMAILNNGRTGLGGGSVGMMKRLIGLASSYAGERKQFGHPIIEYGMIKEKIGKMVIDCYVAESMVTMVAGLIDNGYEDYAIEAAISKVFSSEATGRTADEALQTAGGSGFMREYPYERFVRDCRINRIFEGTNEVLRLFIALTALKDVGEGLRELQSSVKGVFDHPIKGFGVMSEYAWRRAQLAVGFGKNGIANVHPELQEAGVIFRRTARALAQAADRILRKHGKNIIGEQVATRRLADIMIDLFGLVSVLSRVDAAIRAKGVQATAHEREILHVFAVRVERRTQDGLARIDDNEDDLVASLAVNTATAAKYRWDTV